MWGCPLRLPGAPGPPRLHSQRGRCLHAMAPSGCSPEGVIAVQDPRVALGHRERLGVSFCHVRSQRRRLPRSRSGRRGRACRPPRLGSVHRWEPGSLPTAAAPAPVGARLRDRRTGKGVGRGSPGPPPRQAGRQTDGPSKFHAPLFHGHSPWPQSPGVRRPPCLWPAPVGVGDRREPGGDQQAPVKERGTRRPGAWLCFPSVV